MGKVCAVLKFDPFNFGNLQKKRKDGRFLNFIEWCTKKQSGTGDVV